MLHILETIHQENNDAKNKCQRTHDDCQSPCNPTALVTDDCCDVMAHWTPGKNWSPTKLCMEREEKRIEEKRERERIEEKRDRERERKNRREER